jgi:phosphatidylinositol 4-kinase
MRCCALYVSLCADRADRRLLQTLCTAPLLHFTESTMALSVLCWEWLLSARVADACEPVEFVREMVDAFLTCARRRLGLFSSAGDPTEAISPLSAHEGISLLPQPPASLGAHRIWVRFIGERVDVAKYCSRDQVEMIQLMFMQSVAISVGGVGQVAGPMDTIGLAGSLAGLSAIFIPDTNFF